MTSINIITEPDVVYMFGDGASYDKDGVLLSITGKAYVLSSLSAAFLFSGRSICAPFIAHHLDRQASDFDELKATIATRLPAMIEHLTDLYGADEKHEDAGQGLRLFVGGWSASRRRPVSFMIGTTEVAGIPPYTPTEPRAGGGWQSPGLSAEQCMLGFGGPPAVNAQTIANVAVTTLELQRQGEAASGEVVSVGGLVELVEVRRDQTEVRILHRWPEDRVGEVMKPVPVDWKQWRRDYPVNSAPIGLSADVPDGLNRQQRRQLDRQRRRA